MGQELIAQDGRVGLELDPVDGDGRRLCDHDSSDRVGHAQVRVLKLELDYLIGQLCKNKANCVLRSKRKREEVKDRIGKEPRHAPER